MHRTTCLPCNNWLDSHMNIGRCDRKLRRRKVKWCVHRDIARKRQRCVLGPRSTSFKVYAFNYHAIDPLKNHLGERFGDHMDKLWWIFYGRVNGKSPVLGRKKGWALLVLLQPPSEKRHLSSPHMSGGAALHIAGWPVCVCFLFSPPTAYLHSRLW